MRTVLVCLLALMVSLMALRPASAWQRRYFVTPAPAWWGGSYYTVSPYVGGYYGYGYSTYYPRWPGYYTSGMGFYPQPVYANGMYLGVPAPRP